MSAKHEKPLDTIVVVHLSSTAIHTVIGEVYSANDIRVIGLASVPSQDFIDGMIQNRERLRANIKQSIQRAEDMANCRVNSVWLTFSTPQLESTNCSGSIPIKNQKIQAEDMVKALGVAKQEKLKNDMYLMSYVQQGVVLDKQDNMSDDVIGMTADSLEVWYHFMMVSVKSCNNLQQLLQDCDVSVDQMLFDGVSTAQYGLLPDEKFQGACLIDIGSGNTNVCVYRENKLVYTRCYRIGGDDVTYDIAAELDITITTAENLKKSQGNLDIETIDPADFFEIKDIKHGEKQCNRMQLFNVIEARYRQILLKIKADLDTAGLSEFLYEGYVVTGGATKIAGFVSYTRQIFSAKVHIVNQNRDIKVGLPFKADIEAIQEHIDTSLTNPCYHTACGALLYSQSDTFLYSNRSDEKSVKHQGFLMKIYAGFSKVIRRNL